MGSLGLSASKNGEQLRLGRAVIPFAIPAEQLEQLCHCLFDIPIGVQRLRQIEPGLMIVGLSLDRRSQFSHRSRISGLLGQFQLRMCRFQLR